MNSNVIPLALFLLNILNAVYAPPVTQNKDKDGKEKHDENEETGGLEDYMEYHRYLREVVNALESDPQFRDKLEKADEQDIRSGKIADELEFVSHNVRSRLDEIKRVELQRLKELTEKQRRIQENIDLEDPTHKHLDRNNPHTFEIDDLKKLIAKTTADLVEADKKRREEFKEYELQKEYDKQLKLNQTAEEAEREKLEKEFREREEKHRKHEPLHEPGHKAQLEEVWKEQDQMQQEFDPKTFFMLHDIDSNGLWDQDEVKALFIKELQKMYAAGEPEDDMRERAEEMERMRESVFKEVDVNRDGFIDYEEFLAQTKRNDFQQDHGWQGLDEKKPYTDQELEEYIRMHQAAQQMHGYPQAYPPPMYQQVPPGHHPNVPVHPNGVPVHPNQMPVHPQQFHPGQLPQQHPQQIPGHLPDLNTNEVYPHQKNQQAYQQGQGNYQHQPPQQHYQGQQANYQQPNYQQQQNYQGNQQQNYQGNQQQNYQQPQQVNQQQQQPQQVNQQQQPQQVNQQQQQQPQQVNQQQQQQVPVQNQQPVQSVPHSAPVQGNVQQQGAPVQANNPNLNKVESPQANKV